MVYLVFRGVVRRHPRGLVDPFLCKDAAPNDHVVQCRDVANFSPFSLISPSTCEPITSNVVCSYFGIVIIIIKLR